MSMVGNALVETLIIIALAIGWMVFINGIALNALYTVQLWLAYKALRRRRAAHSPMSAWYRFR